jgi:hypothetical protein
MRHRSVLLSAMVLVGVVALPARALADPIVVTSGFLTSVGFGNFGRFDLSGSGFSLVGVTDQGNVGPALCLPCEAGSVVAMSTLLPGRLQLSAPAVIDGTPFLGTVEAFLEFTSPSIVVPAGPANFTVQQAFTFSGSVSGAVEETPVFTRFLLGQGTLTANFVRNPNVPDVDAFEFSDITYQFEEAAPVPEPMTLLLVGSGIGALAVRRRRRASRTT